MQKQRAFTLIELLVSIAIIAILVSLSIAGLSNGQKKSRDTRRKEDLKAVQHAFEQYYTAHGAYFGGGSLESLTKYVNDMQTSDGQVYLPAGAPLDPKEDGAGGYTYTIQANDAGYCVCAKLESSSGNACGSAITTSCSYESSTSCQSSGDPLSYFCVSNLQ